MRYRNIGITLTRKCSAQCDICCFESSPSCSESLDEEVIKRFVNTSKDIEEIKEISFTGGEPFLDYELLLRLTEHAKSVGKRSSVITNCFWATSQDVTTEKLAKLKMAGLYKVGISYDNWHAQFISHENVKRVITACAQLLIPVQIGIICIKGERVGKLIDELGDESLNLRFQTSPCLPVGAAKKNISQDNFLSKEFSGKLPCMYDGNLVVFYDGKIYPCCSQMIAETELCVGDYRTDSVADVLKRIKNNAILYLLRNRGVDYFLDEAKAIGIEIPDKIVNQCELCALLFNKENLESFLPFVKKELKDYV